MVALVALGLAQQEGLRGRADERAGGGRAAGGRPAARGACRRRAGGRGGGTGPTCRSLAPCQPLLSIPSSRRAIARCGRRATTPRWSRRSCCPWGRGSSRPARSLPGCDVLDVAAGTGNASIPAARAGATVTACDLTPELLEAGSRRAAADGVELDWVEADAEHLPFEDESFDVVMSSIGAMFAPHHQAVADELDPRVPAGRHDRAAELDARGDDRRAVPDDGTVRPAAAARRPAAAAVGQRGAPARALRRARARSRRCERQVLEVTAFDRTRTTTASTSRRATARPSRHAPTRRRTAARASSTRRWTGSATSGTAARPTARASRWSTCSPSAPETEPPAAGYTRRVARL